MMDQSERIILRELDIDKFNEIVSESLREDNIAESCYTNFKDVVVETIGQTISTILEKDGWKIKRFGELTMFSEEDSEKLFNAFMKNSEFTVTLKKKIDNKKYEFKEVIIKFDFPEEEKKRIAREYIDNLTIAIHYLEICLFDEEDEDMDADTIAKILSNEVWGLLSPEEIKAEYINETQNVNDDNDDVDDEEE
jgi:hypothetical protein